MNPNIAANQQRLFLEFLAELRPHLRRDTGLPGRIKAIFARNRALGSRDRKLYRELIYTAVRFLPWVDGGALQREGGQAAGLAPTAGSEAGGARSAGALGARDEQSLLDTDPILAGKIIAWLLPTLPPTEAYQKAICDPWVLAPEKSDLQMKAFMLRAYCGGSRPVPSLAERAAELRQQLSPGGARLSEAPSAPFNPQALLPAWFREHCPAAFSEPHLSAINSRAWIWVRVQCADRQLVMSEFLSRQWALGLPADFPDAICLPPNAEVAGTDAYRRGFVEIQDLGSQMVLAHVPITPGERWLDACAGAGGKSLQLARLLPGGHVDATDIRPEILEELRDRAKRARLDNITIVRDTNHSRSVIARSPADDEAIQHFDRLSVPRIVEGLDRHGALRAPRDDKNIPLVAADYNGVLVDAPCSGSGTWRRQPHLKWCVQPEAIAAFAKMQREILTTNALLVKPGGLLVYATCSLSHHENQDVVAGFLKSHAQFKAESPVKNHGGEFDGLGTTLLPGTRNTDGFYVALLRRFS